MSPARRERADAREIAERAIDSASELAAITSERVRRFGENAIRTPANAVTILRLLFAIPVLIWILDKGRPSWAIFTSWLILWLTDFLDGYLARRDGTTRSGAFLDPLADKILVLGGFIALAINGDFGWVPVGIITGREVLISAYRIYEGRRGYSLPARWLGKFKANVQFLVVSLVLLPPTADDHNLHEVAVWVTVAITVISAIDLLYASFWEE